MIDFRSIGVVILKCLFGYPALYCPKIVRNADHFEIPEAHISPEDSYVIVMKYSVLKIKNHAWFRTIPFDDLLAMKAPCENDPNVFDESQEEKEQHELYHRVDKTYYWGYNTF